MSPRKFYRNRIFHRYWAYARMRLACQCALRSVHTHPFRHREVLEFWSGPDFVDTMIGLRARSGRMVDRGRLARNRRAVQSQTGRSNHASCQAARQAAQGFSRDDEFQSLQADRGERAGTDVRARSDCCSESRMGRRYHVHPNARGLLFLAALLDLFRVALSAGR